jgi:thioredoxin 1
MVQELSQDNLAELVSDNKTVVVQYTATWCGNCRIMKPKFKKLASENENITFVILKVKHKQISLMY